MPTYDFKCDKCDKRIEENASINLNVGDILKPCVCGGKLRKIFSVPGLIIVKGNQGAHWNNALNKYGHERHA